MLKKTLVVFCLGLALMTSPVLAEDLLQIYELALQQDPQLLEAENHRKASPACCLPWRSWGH